LFSKGWIPIVPLPLPESLFVGILFYIFCNCKKIAKRINWTYWPSWIGMKMWLKKYHDCDSIVAGINLIFWLIQFKFILLWILVKCIYSMNVGALCDLLSILHMLFQEVLWVTVVNTGNQSMDSILVIFWTFHFVF
jgi:hypothetical protein